MGFFDFVRKLNPFKSKKAAEAVPYATPFQQMVQQALPSPELAPPQWDEEKLKALTSEKLETPKDLLDAFLYFGEWIDTTYSSNVAAIHYDPDDSTLQIRFKNGGIYQYDDVSIREAESFARSSSRGKWVWDNLRRRGTTFGFNRAHPYTFLSGPSGAGLGGYTPQWFRSEAVRRLHGKVPDTGAQNKSIFKRLMPRRGPFARRQS